MDEPKREAWLSTEEVIERIHQAMAEKRPLSVVRVGDGENICLAQYKVWSIRKTLYTRWARLSRTTNWKGVRLPNVLLREQLIASIKKADIVGIPYENDREILAKQHTLRPLTDRCFRRYKIRPKAVCHTFVNRHMVEYESFWEMLRGKKAVVISRWAGDLKRWVGTKYNDFDIDFTRLIRIDRFEEIPKVLRKMEKVECDIVLISAGVNAVILAERLAREQGRVAIDFGKSAVFMVKGDRKVRPWRPRTAKARAEISVSGPPSAPRAQERPPAPQSSGGGEGA
ncbi:GT-D fold domain-containing glycosyltransferase [Paenibacillus sp.]|uniref:GT-D fold domain-containing protein n=1 Tax=Paenibacillus sp. TaxID=58172 RepID=UPI0028123507|nr:GT-D fold domain-containing glycosyltransferase [Paenibacillus sp.]